LKSSLKEFADIKFALDQSTIRNDPEREAPEGMRHEVERIDKTVRALLDRARPRVLAAKPSSLTEVARRAVNVARAQLASSRARADRITIEFDAPAERRRSAQYFQSFLHNQKRWHWSRFACGAPHRARAWRSR
jgi:signal transduction histidine kinase